MLKITVQKNGQWARMVLEGSLTSAWVEEARRTWRQLDRERRVRLIVDLTGVSHIDTEGRSLLVAMYGKGADLQATGCYIKTVVQEIMGSPGVGPEE